MTGSRAAGRRRAAALPSRIASLLIFFGLELALFRIRVYIMCIMQFSGRGEIAFLINSRPAVKSATPFQGIDMV